MRETGCDIQWVTMAHANQGLPAEPWLELILKALIFIRKILPIDASVTKLGEWHLGPHSLLSDGHSNRVVVGMMEDRFSVLLFRTCFVGCLLGLVGTIYFLLGLAGYVSSSLLNTLCRRQSRRCNSFLPRNLCRRPVGDQLGRTDPLVIHFRHSRN